MPQPDDAYSAMLALRMQLAAKEAAGQRLPTDERIIAEVGLYRQSRLNGFFSCAMNRLPHAAVQVLRALPEKSCDIVRPQ